MKAQKKSKRQFATLKLQEIFDEGLVATKGQSPGPNLPRLPLASSTRLKVLTIGGCAEWSCILETTPSEKWIGSQVNKTSIMKKDEKGWKRGHTQNYTNTYLQGTSRNIKEPKQGKKVDPNVGCSVRWNQHLCAAYLLGHPVFSVFGGLRFVFVQGLHVIHALFTWGSSYVTRWLCYASSQLKL